jgi:MFS family permease
VVGALVFGLGAGSVALGAGCWPFWLSMVVLTLSELIMLPTGIALTARLAPPEMRGRYMGLVSLSWAIAGGIGPLLGGVLSDQVAPAATWVGGLVTGVLPAAGFAWLAGRLKEG